MEDFGGQVRDFGIGISLWFRGYGISSISRVPRSGTRLHSILQAYRHHGEGGRLVARGGKHYESSLGTRTLRALKVK